MAIRYALRTLTRDSGFAAVAVFTLALGIGANTAIFSLINSVLLQAVPYPDSDRLVTIEEIIPKIFRQFGPFPVNGRHFMEWRKQSKSFEQLAAIDSRRLTLTGSGEPEQIAAAYVSANCFPLLRVQPALGRNFLEEEDIQGHNRVAILTDSLWRRRFSANRGIIGQTILLDGAPHVVVGVLPPTFHFFANHELSSLATLEPRTDVFRPIAIKAEEIGLMGEFNYAAIGKLKPGVTREQALAELNIIEASLVAQVDSADRSELKASLTPLKEQMTGQSRRGLLVLLAAVGAVLLIVCVNLANLMLARAVARRRDAAIRTALGASRWDLIGHVLTESLMLSLAGGLLGLLAADWGVGLLVKAAPVDLPRLAEVHIDPMVLGFALLLTMVTGILSGILPAWRLSSAEPADALRSGGRSGTEGAHGLRVRNLLVASEVALSAMLLIAAGLLLHSFVRLMKLDKGFDTSSVLAADITLPAARYKEDAMRVKTFDRLLPKIRSIPGVKAAGLVSVLPLEGEGWGDMISVEGQRGGAIMERPLGNYRFVSPGYFAAIGIPLLQGRVIEERDRNGHPAVISETVAKRLFHGENPIGKRFRRGDPAEAPFEVVGVVGNIPIASLQKAPGLLVYVPYWYRSRMKFSLVARTTIDPVLAAPALRSAVREIDSDVPLGEIRTMDQVVSHSVAPRRFQLALVLLFAASALALASLGIYGVVSYMVAQRRAEIGIRMALGAEGSDVHRLILRQGLRPVLAGLVLGILGALMLTRLLNSLLFQVSGYDPATFIAVTAVLLGIATLACLIPSRRAVGADPSAVLRYE
jgi:predicted permease